MVMFLVLHTLDSISLNSLVLLEYLASMLLTSLYTRNILLTRKLLKKRYWYHKLHKTFSKFYRRYDDLISKFQVGFKSLLRQGISEPEVRLTRCETG